MRKTAHVLLLLTPFGSYDRGLLRGIGRYAQLRGPWVFHVSGEYPGLPLPSFETVNETIVSLEQAMGVRSRVVYPDLVRWGATGVIARVQSPEIADSILRCGAPLIVLDRSAEQLAPGSPLAKASEVRPDSESAGLLAAEHLLERGFQRFAFCGYAGRLWSDRRRDGFRRRLQEACADCEVYEPPSRRAQQTWNRELPLVQSWLRSLPKPVGILTCNDIRGRQLLDVCLLSDIKVPDEVAVIGVDDDALLCELANPPLSSVAMNTEQGGYRAAELLDAMMSGKVRKPQLIEVEPLWVSARRSTDVIAVEDRHVAEALQFIRGNARWSISVGDVIAAAGISRRSLEIRFQRSIGRPIREEIQRVRLSLAKRLLLETNLPVWKIAESSGFNSLNYLARVFRRDTEMTMAQYRRRHHS